MWVFWKIEVTNGTVFRSNFSSSAFSLKINNFVKWLIWLRILIGIYISRFQVPGKMNIMDFELNTTPYSLHENQAISQLLAIATAVDALGKKHVAKGQHTTTGYQKTNVPCGLQELHAYIEAEDNSSNYIENIEEAYNDHHSINYYAVSLPKPVHDREFHTSVITKVECRKGHNSQRSLLHRRESEKRSPRSSSG